MKEKTEYCCIWCHEALTKDKTFVNSRGSTVCSGCRGLGAVMLAHKPHKNCKLKHSVKRQPESAVCRNCEHSLESHGERACWLELCECKGFEARQPESEEEK